ncbi:Matrix-remodeling-associated protein 5 [Liparis tanakae]|uniref:Matrix-remodeling-associated protein 5 n=1 Tax=Liparis tanakae TaxID=230148 RepID=A0A4Z2GRB3_9TELE|nr:Matrix-remodeling-associated protein 5 [Liparis tanakae]
MACDYLYKLPPFSLKSFISGHAMTLTLPKALIGKASLDLMECWNFKSIIDPTVLGLVPQCGPQALREHSFKVRLQEVQRGQACPRSCNCYQANEVHCTFRSLLTVPSGLPPYTRRINLGFNSISRIHDTSLAGLKKVELLMLHSNDLHHLPDAAFRDLKSLQILKLSYNKLREISSSLTFSGLTSLLRLYLDHNLLQHIHPRALLQLTSLRVLRLQGNRLHQLHPHSLCTLSLLNTYYFSTLRLNDMFQRPSVSDLCLAQFPPSETAVRLERDIMLSKAPALAYRYKQAAETDGHYHTGVEAFVKGHSQPQAGQPRYALHY